MAEIKAQGASPDSTTKLFRYFMIALVLGTIISFLIGMYNKYSGVVGSSEQYEVVSTVTCQPNEALFAESGGWCSSEVLPAGQYQISLVSWDLKLVTGSGLKVTGSEIVPEEGIPLSRWSGQSYEQQFKAEAPNGKALRVAAPLYRIGSGKATPMTEQFFTLTHQNRVKVGINILPTAGAYKGNAGGMTVEISRLSVPEERLQKTAVKQKSSGGFLAGLLSFVGIICLLIILGLVGWWAWVRFVPKSSKKK